MQALTFRNGILYGIGGDEEDLPRSFSCDPATRGFTIGGLLSTGPVNSYLGLMYEPIGAFIAEAAGNIYLSTTGRMGNLYVWNI